MHGICYSYVSENGTMTTYQLHMSLFTHFEYLAINVLMYLYSHVH